MPANVLPRPRVPDSQGMRYISKRPFTFLVVEIHHIHQFDHRQSSPREKRIRVRGIRAGLLSLRNAVVAQIPVQHSDYCGCRRLSHRQTIVVKSSIWDTDSRAGISFVYLESGTKKP